MKYITMARLSLLIALSLAFSGCGLFEGTSLEKRIERLSKDAQRLVEQIKDEADPDRRSTLQKDLKEVQDNLQDLLQDLGKEGEKIDVKGFLNDMGKGIEDLGEKLQDGGK